MAAGADTSSRNKSFVCHSTPHFDSTSRKAPTLFVPIIHETSEKVKRQTKIFLFCPLPGQKTSQGDPWEALLF